MAFEQLEFGPRQRATITAALTLIAAMVLLLASALLVWGLALFVGAFKNVLLPPVVAAILAMLLRPHYDWVLKCCGGSQASALVLFSLSALIPLGVGLWFAGVFAVKQLIQFVEDLPAMVAAVREAGQAHWPEVATFLEKYELLARFRALLDDPGSMVANLLQASGEQLSDSLLQLAGTVGGMFAWAVLPVYLAFFLMAQPFQAKRINDFMPFLKREIREDITYLAEQFIEILLTFFRGQIIIALTQGVLYAIGFAAVGLPYGVMIGIVLGLLNIIPYLGSMVGLGVALPLAYFSGDSGWILPALVLAVFCVVQLVESYLLTPKIMGDRTGLSPALIIFAVFFWGVALNGILGMMLAIPLTAFAVVFWRLLKKKYFADPGERCNPL